MSKPNTKAGGKYVKQQHKNWLQAPDYLKKWRHLHMERSEALGLHQMGGVRQSLRHQDASLPKAEHPCLVAAILLSLPEPVV